MDAIVGLMLLIALASVLAVAVNQQAAASRKLAERRAAQRAAEATLVALQSGQPAPNQSGGDATVVTTLESPAPAGWKWVRVERRSSGSGPSVQLVGLVPGEAARGGAE
jgi:hypothetical protein